MMITVEDIKKAVERLSPDELAKFRTWWVEVDAGFLKTNKRKAVNAKVAKLVTGAKRDLRAARRKSAKKKK